jgi:hypothetical protein
MLPSSGGRDASVRPSPGDHVRAIVELLRPATPDLARRWLAALLLVPEDERAAVVSEVERSIVAMYVREEPREDARQFSVVYPPQQRAGYVEEVRAHYELPPGEPGQTPAVRRVSKSERAGERTGPRRGSRGAG